MAMWLHGMMISGEEDEREKKQCGIAVVIWEEGPWCTNKDDY